MKAAKSLVCPRCGSPDLSTIENIDGLAAGTAFLAGDGTRSLYDALVSALAEREEG